MPTVNTAVRFGLVLVCGIALLAGPRDNVPIKLVLVNPSGFALQTLDSVNGVAVLKRAGFGVGQLYGQGDQRKPRSVQVWTAATPTLTR